MTVISPSVRESVRHSSLLRSSYSLNTKYNWYVQCDYFFFSRFIQSVLSVLMIPGSFHDHRNITANPAPEARTAPLSCSSMTFVRTEYKPEVTTPPLSCSSRTYFTMKYKHDEPFLKGKDYSGRWHSQMWLWVCAVMRKAIASSHVRVHIAACWSMCMPLVSADLFVNMYWLSYGICQSSSLQRQKSKNVFGKHSRRNNELPNVDGVYVLWIYSVPVSNLLDEVLQLLIYIQE